MNRKGVRCARRTVRYEIAAVLAATLAGPAAAGDAHRLVLADGREVEGIVVPATEGTWIVQTRDVCLEVAAGEIRSADGKAGAGALPARGAVPLLRAETFEEVLPSGDVVVHASFARENRGSAVLDEVEWGIAPHEVALLPDWRVFDEYGTELAVAVEEQEGGARRAKVRLPRPIVPGETVRMSHRTLHRGYVTRDGDAVRWRHRGDYPEDRLVTKLVRLPAGAEVVSVTPEPAQRFEHDGATCVLWRRYYVAGEERPLEVRFRPAAPGS
jgi:hypothetical protein